MSWPLIAIKEVAKVVTGKTPSTADDQNFGGHVPFVTPAELGLDVYVMDAPRTLSAKGASAIKLVPRNAVMVCCIGSLGKMAIAGTPIATNQQINSVIFDEHRVDAKYGFYALQLLKPKMEAMAPSTTVAIVNKGNFEAMQIPLPPLPEQKRIAAILDKADAIRRKRQQAIQLADDFLRAVFLDMFGDPVTNPKGWPVEPLGSLVINKDGKRRPIKASDRADIAGKYPYYGASGVIDYVNDFIFEGPHLLVGEDGANLLARSTSIAFIADGQYWVNNHAHVLGEKNGIPLDYLAFSINMRSLEPFVSGSAQPKLNQENLNKIPVQVPPSVLMEKFLAVLKMHRSYMERASASEPENLFVSLNQKTFSGQL